MKNLKDAALVTVREDVVRFLLGEGPLDGLWFGDLSPDLRGAFWWRNPLRLSMHPASPSASAQQIQNDTLSELQFGLALLANESGENLTKPEWLESVKKWAHDMNASLDASPSHEGDIHKEVEQQHERSESKIAEALAALPSGAPTYHMTRAELVVPAVDLKQAHGLAMDALTYPSGSLTGEERKALARAYLRLEAERAAVSSSAPIAWFFDHGTHKQISPTERTEPGWNPLYTSPVSATLDIDHRQNLTGDAVLDEVADELGVQRFANTMRAKLAEKRLQGYSGWNNDCSRERLEQLLAKHIEKPWDERNLTDIANFCMMLWNREHPCGTPDGSPSMSWYRCWKCGGALNTAGNCPKHGPQNVRNIGGRDHG